MTRRTSYEPHPAGAPGLVRGAPDVTRITDQPSQLGDVHYPAAVKDHRLLAGVVVAVLAIWLVGAAVTKYSLEQMALFAPIAVCVLGATVAVVMVWVKVILQLRRERRERRA